MSEKYFASDNKLFFVTRSEISSKSDLIYLAVTLPFSVLHKLCVKWSWFLKEPDCFQA